LVAVIGWEDVAAVEVFAGKGERAEGLAAGGSEERERTRG
jgi:hypothetical protein